MFYLKHKLINSNYIFFKLYFVLKNHFMIFEEQKLLKYMLERIFAWKNTVRSKYFL